MNRILIRWYKNKKREKYEDLFSSWVHYNMKRIRLYKESLTRLPDDYDCTPIAMCYTMEHLDRIQEKYSIGGFLVANLRWSFETAMLEFDRMKERVETHKQEVKERKQINLYKKAIKEAVIELKHDGFLLDLLPERDLRGTRALSKVGVPIRDKDGKYRSFSDIINDLQELDDF